MKNKTPIGAALFAFLLLSTLLTSPIPQAHATWYTPPTEKMKFPMMVLSWDDWSVHSGEAIAEELKQVGISVEVVPTDDSAMYPRLYDRDYGMEEMSYGVVAYPVQLFYHLSSSTDCSNCGQDWSFRNATVDAAINQMMQTVDKDKARELVWKVDQMAQENVPYIPLFLSDEYHAFRKEWTNYTVMPAGPISYLNWLTMPYIYSTAGKKDFIIAFNSEPETFSPMAATSGRSLFYSQNVYDTLLAYDKDLNLIPWMTTGLPDFSSDGMTMTFHLKQGLKWHDGQPLTAKDVVFTFQYIVANSAVGGNSGEIINYFDSGETPDDLTAVIHLKQPYAWAAEAFGTQYIVPEHIWSDTTIVDKYDWDQTLVQSNPKITVGSGPFMFSEWVPGEYVKLVRNPNWWMTGHPLIDTMFFRKIDTESARMLAIQKGEVDTERYSVEPSFIENAKTNPDLVVTHAVDQWDYLLAFNNGAPGYTQHPENAVPFNDIWVRRAIAYALDKDEIVKRGALGYGTVMTDYCYRPFFPSWCNPNSSPAYPHDPAKANKILDEQGYLDIDGDGIRELKPVVAAFQRQQQIQQQQLMAKQQAQMVQYLTYAAIAVIIIIAALYFFLYRRRKKA
jgi:ABC-type transport system substrate-binding protein